MKGKINQYSCPDKHYTTTKNMDSGILPRMIECKHEGCVFFAKITSLNVNQKKEHTHEFRKADKQKIKDLQPYPEALEFVLNGGLILGPKQ